MAESKGFPNEQLIHILEQKELNLQTKSELKALEELAIKNKVLLQLLRSLDIRDTLRETQEKALKKITHTAELISKVLRDHSYAFFKLVKPISYVPADIDILVSVKHVGEAIKSIRSLGYDIAVKDPYCVTFVKEGSIIDVYTYPSIGGTVFIDGQKLLEHVRETTFGYADVRALEPYAEALVVAAHAIYKELIYTLNDYFTIKKWADWRSLRLADELGCRPALELAMRLNWRIGNELLDMPYKIPTSLWLSLLLKKLWKDELVRGTSTNILKTLIRRSSRKMIASKLKRETY